MEATPGMSPVPLLDIKESLNLKLNWFSAASESPAQTSAIINACAAVASGLARHVICFRTLTEASSQTAERRASVVGGGPNRVGGKWQWQIPFCAFSAANWIGLFAQRHFHEFGTTREQLAQIALNDRKNAMLNPRAIFRNPLTMDEYLNARTISTPFCLFDCDIPIDGSVAVIVSHVDTIKDLKCKSIHVEAVGSALHGRDSWDQFDDLTTMAARDAAKMMWSRTDLKPADVDVANLYDGFSFITLAWLEALGFCPRGEGGRFIEGGQNIARDGVIPLNTAGGQLSAGRMHGFGLLHETCVQLRGEGEERQVKDAKLGVVGTGGGPLGSCLLLKAA
jgi:acetyl-CoA acetyltransferase